MSLIQFNGIVQVPLPWSSSTVTTPSFSGSPPRANFNDAQSTANISPDNSNIIWTGDVPLYLRGLSVNSLVKSDIISKTNFVLKRTVTNTITSGKQQSEDFGKPLIRLYFLYNDTTIDEGFDIESLEWNSSPCLSGFGPSEEGYSYPFNNQNPKGNLVLETVNNTDLPSFKKITKIQVMPWNQCNQCTTVNFDCENRNVTEFTMIMVMNISISIPCSSGFDLETQFCKTYCTEPENQTNCFPQYEQFCLIDKGSDGNINLFTNETCDKFIQQYLTTQGPQSNVDSRINGACLQYNDISEYNEASVNIQNICACHLPIGIYDRLRNSLIQEFPGFETVDENERCLFPPCPSSNYQISIPIGKFCRLPPCINLASINNNGTIKGGTQINQKCDISNQNGTGGNQSFPEEAKSWLEKHWVWLVIGISILVVLIIVILIILASEGNKKKPKKEIEKL